MLWRARAAIVRAYRHAMARLGEPVLGLVLLGLKRVRVEVEHLQVWVEDMYNRRTAGALSRESLPTGVERVIRQAREQRGEGRRVSVV